MTARRVAIVPHTHWDREWYEPFQAFRMRLVEVIDGLLDLMERDSSYRHFLLDGQTALVDDYLAIRPDAVGRLQNLRASGRVSIGPFSILMDEFLVSGETIVRNLESGLRRADELGGSMAVGYLPDMFGHIAQMPQLLRLAGIEHAVVWRGVPSDVDRTAFRWRAPDGSDVRAEYLVAGYGNGAALPDDAKALLRRLDNHLEEVGPFLGADDPLLVMNGSDHLPPQPWLGRVVDEVNRMQSAYELTVCSLPEYLEHAPNGALPEWRGELRSGARANMLMGVSSNRLDVRRAAARTERMIERLAEPLSALFLDAANWPAPYLELAWTELVRNAAHDSICACSVDEVVDAVLHRYAEARQIGEGLVRRAIDAISCSMTGAGTFVVNPTQADRGGLVEVVVTGDEPPGACVQVLSERFALPDSMTMSTETVRNLIGLVQGSRVDRDTYVTDVAIDEDASGIDLTVVIGTRPRRDVPIEELKRDLFTRLAVRPESEVRLHLDQPPIRRVLAVQRTVPGFGWSRFAPAPLFHPVRVNHDPEGTITMSNDLVTVTVDRLSGTFSMDGTPGYGALVDGGDHGDTYNYSPPAHDVTVDHPGAVEVAVEEEGPVRARVSVIADYTWPYRVDDTTRSRIGERPVRITTTIELQAEEASVRVDHQFVNVCRDHRLRVHLPLPEPARQSRAECAFAVVERALVAEGRSGELGLPTFPSRRFVSAGGLTVVHDGLPEYELVDITVDPTSGEQRAGTLALTLLRSTGMLSRLGMSNRPLPAGPLIPLEGSQCLGPIRATYALATGDVDPYRMADDVLVPLAVGTATGGGTRFQTGSTLIIRGAEVSAVRRCGGLLEVRVFNPTATTTTVEVPDRTGWLVGLGGRPLAPFAAGFDLRAFGIATFRLDPD